MADATIILAGGTGTRLWPASIRSHPKQLLRIAGGPSLIQRAVGLATATGEGPVVIVTGEDQVSAIDENIREAGISDPDLPGRVVYLPEPVGRNTAPAIALGMIYLRQSLPADGTVLVLTADHVIGPPGVFAVDADKARELALDGNLVCFGISPDRPETGYGYIHAGEPLQGGYRVQAFKEKPDVKTAQEYVTSGGYYWNAGMFAFAVSGFFSELRQHAPEIDDQFHGLVVETPKTTASGASSADPDSLRDIYAVVPRISIDYALMERSDRVAVVPATFSWSDVGSWDELARISREEAPEDKPVVIEVDAQGNHVDSDLPVAICGVSDVHVVVRNGRVLVCRRGQSQLVKRVVETAESTGQDDLL